MSNLVLTTQQACNSLMSSRLVEDGLIGFNTTEAETALIAKLQTIFESKGYAWSTNNLIGIRMSDVYTNEFTDYGVIVVGNTLSAYPISTKPGLSYLTPPKLPANGCACLVEGQYINMWKWVDTFGGWSGDPYFQQINPCSVYRELTPGTSINRNSKVDTGNFGINNHSWKNFNGGFVMNLSEGCQVEDENIILEEERPIVLQAFKDVPVTYTLLNITDF